jgi:DNA-binding protein H-NS
MIQDLIQQREELDRQIEQIKSQERSTVIDQVKSLVLMHGLTEKDVFACKTSKFGKAKAKYRDPATGKTWTGRGRNPTWFDSNRESDFLIGA